MFARFFAVASLVALVAAVPPLLVARDQCTASTVNTCCSANMPANQALPLVEQLNSTLVGVLAGVTANVGLGCSAIIGDSANCQQTPLCCTNNTSSGIAIDCTPIEVDA